MSPTAQIAVQQGYCVARNLYRELTGQKPVPFRPQRLGTFVSLGRKEALGVLNLTRFLQLRFSGWAARMLKRQIVYRYLWDIGGPGLVLRKLRENRRMSSVP